jgi:hypothetical protein
MGEMADYFIDRMINGGFEVKGKRKRDLWEDMTWTTKSGERILIREMTDFHLENSRKMLERKGYSREPEYLRIVEEIEKRKEKADGRKNL